MSTTAGHKRKNEDKTESTPKRRRYMSPPPPSPPPKQQTIYIIKRNLSDKERNNELKLSTTLSMKFALTGREVVNFGRDPKNQLCLHSTRKVRYSKGREHPNDVMISREHGKFICRDDKWYILDKKSTNGIIVNGTQIAPNKEHPLDIDDEIVIGKNLENTEFKYIFTTKPTYTSTTTPGAPSTPRTAYRPHARSPLKETPRLDSDSQNSQNSLDTAQLKNMMEALTKNMLAEQNKKFEEAMKKKEDENEALRTKLQQQQLAEITAKEAENKKKQEELAKKALELKEKQEDVIRKQKEQQTQMQMEKEKIAKEIEQQKAQLVKQQEIETKKSREREAAAKKKLEELKKQQQEIAARDKKQRERNDIEHQKWVEKQEKLKQEKKKIEDKEREIKEKEAKVKEEMEQKQQSMEEECTCCMCYDLLVASRSLQCGHTSCHQCLDQWMNEQKTCPSCRNPITREPVPCIIVDNLIVDTYLKDKPEEERTEYMQRRREYEEWKKKKEEEEKRKAAAAAAALARRNVMNNNNWRGYVANNQRHGGGNNWLNINNNIVRSSSVDRNNRNNNHVVQPFGGMMIPLQPQQAPRAHNNVLPLQMIVNNANNANNNNNILLNQNRNMAHGMQPFQQVLRGNNAQNRNIQRRNNNNNPFYRRA